MIASGQRERAGRSFAGKGKGDDRAQTDICRVAFRRDWPMATGASAITAELAKKCEVLMAKAHSPRQAGNPAAGSAKGTAKDQRAYFDKCVANGGKVDDSDSKETK